MLPFDGSNPRSITVMDNWCVHHVETVKDLFREAGILLLFLPPYSPDLNPIEEAFSKVKYYWKEHNAIMQCIPDQIPLLRAAFNSITSDDCKGWAMQWLCRLD